MTTNQSSEQTHKELIQLVASEIGNHHKPAVYIETIKKDYDIEVSHSSITKSLGSLWSRLRINDKQAVEQGKRLLSMCYRDKALANYYIKKAMLS